MDQLAQIGRFIGESLLRIWPFLVISIPLAVLLHLSGLAQRLRGAFNARPVAAVFLATAAGAFSPFCSCTVIPVISSLLLGGVPLAPVMAFWIGSPTMDPEIFFLSVSMLGWPVAIARLASTVLLSLAAGFVTLALERRGVLGEDILRIGGPTRVPVFSWRTTSRRVLGITPGAGAARKSTEETDTDASAEPSRLLRWVRGVRRNRIWKESVAATLTVAKFMVLAFLLEALIKLYVPQEAIVGWIGAANPAAPALGALIGIPVYTGGLMALPIVGGLMQQGMDPGAALSFLIAGPITTIPAMAAVWGVVKRRVFVLYLAIGLVGALAFGYAYSLVNAAFLR